MNPDEKTRIAHRPGPDPQRGWSHVGAESSSGLYRKGFLQSQENLELKDARVGSSSPPNIEYSNLHSTIGTLGPRFQDRYAIS